MFAIAIVPAAGKGQRFGGAKLLAPVDGQPLLGRTLSSLLDAGVAHVIVVSSPGSALDGVIQLSDSRVQVVVNPDPSRGMFSSIQIGLAAALALSDPENTADAPVLILPGDMPFVKADTAAAVLDACGRTHRIVSPRHLGRRGHPLAMPRRFLSGIISHDPATTLSAALETFDRLDLDVDDPGILRDVDVVADLYR